jgi:hypothetical protein
MYCLQHNTEVHLLYQNLQEKMESRTNAEALAEMSAPAEDFESPLMSVPTPAPLTPRHHPSFTPRHN